MLDWLHQLHSTEGLMQLLRVGGTALAAAIVFTETGLFIGFFLPGDSLLLVAGALSGMGTLPAPGVLILALAAAAVVGDAVNYAFGRYVGAKARTWRDGRFFKQRYLAEAEDFYRRWGALGVIAGRFVPIVRTFVPFVAGMAEMPRHRFLIANIAGALVWVVSLIWIGHAVGQRPYLQERLHLMVLAVVALSFLPIAIGLLRRWLGKRRARASRATAPVPPAPASARSDAAD